MSSCATLASNHLPQQHPPMMPNAEPLRNVQKPDPATNAPSQAQGTIYRDFEGALVGDKEGGAHLPLLHNEASEGAAATSLVVGNGTGMAGRFSADAGLAG